MLDIDGNPPSQPRKRKSLNEEIVVPWEKNPKFYEGFRSHMRISGVFQIGAILTESVFWVMQKTHGEWNYSLRLKKPCSYETLNL